MANSKNRVDITTTWELHEGGAYLTVLLILLQDELLVALYGLSNLVQQVATSLTRQALQCPGGVSGLDGLLPAGVGGLLGGLRVCNDNINNISSNNNNNNSQVCQPTLGAY